MSVARQAVSELVLLEIPVEADVDRFRMLLRPRRTGSPRLDHGAWLVAVEAPDIAGLEAVLGDVRAILPEFGLTSIRCCRRSRVFELTGGPRAA